MKKVIIGLFSVVLLTIFASYGFCAETCPPPVNPEQGFRGENMHSMMPMRPPRMETMGAMPEAANLFRWRIKKLGLDRKQEEAIKGIRSGVLKKMIRLRADERIAGIELRDLLDKDTVDMKAVEAKLRQMETERTALQLSLIRAGEEIKSNLTAVQRKKLRSMQEKACDMMPPMERMGRGAMRMPPPPFRSAEEDTPPTALRPGEGGR